MLKAEIFAIFVFCAFAGASDEGKLIIEVSSVGCSDSCLTNCYSSIQVNGVEHSPAQSGLNIATVDPYSALVTSTRNFKYLQGDLLQRNSLKLYIETIPEGSIIIISTQKQCIAYNDGWYQLLHEQLKFEIGDLAGLSPSENSIIVACKDWCPSQLQSFIPKYVFAETQAGKSQLVIEMEQVKEKVWKEDGTFFEPSTCKKCRKMYATPSFSNLFGNHTATTTSTTLSSSHPTTRSTMHANITTTMLPSSGDSDSSYTLPLIIGGVGVGFVVILIILIVCICRRKIVKGKDHTMEGTEQQRTGLVSTVRAWMIKRKQDSINRRIGATGEHRGSLDIIRFSNSYDVVRAPGINQTASTSQLSTLVTMSNYGTLPSLAQSEASSIMADTLRKERSDTPQSYTSLSHGTINSYDWPNIPQPYDSHNQNGVSNENDKPRYLPSGNTISDVDSGYLVATTSTTTTSDAVIHNSSSAKRHSDSEYYSYVTNPVSGTSKKDVVVSSTGTLHVYAHLEEPTWPHMSKSSSFQLFCESRDKDLSKSAEGSESDLEEPQFAQYIKVNKNSPNYKVPSNVPKHDPPTYMPDRNLRDTYIDMDVQHDYAEAPSEDYQELRLQSLERNEPRYASYVDICSQPHTVFTCDDKKRTKTA